MKNGLVLQREIGKVGSVQWLMQQWMVVVLQRTVELMRDQSESSYGHRFEEVMV
jgi:hypothetical protein